MAEGSGDPSEQGVVNPAWHAGRKAETHTPAFCAMKRKEAKTLPQAKEHRPPLRTRRRASQHTLSGRTVPQAGRLDPVPTFREIQTLTAQADGGNPASSQRADPWRKDWGEVWGPRPRPPRPPPAPGVLGAGKGTGRRTAGGLRRRAPGGRRRPRPAARSPLPRPFSRAGAAAAHSLWPPPAPPPSWPPASPAPGAPSRRVT